ncbi:MAG: LamG domain-containing protein [Planctomycetota bacterium]
MMARAFLSTSGQYLYVDQTPVTGPPFTIACWFCSTDLSAVQCLMFVGDKGSGNPGDPIYVQSRDSTGTSSAVSTSGYSANTWHHACGVFASATDRRAFIDGGSKGTDSTSRSPVGLDRVATGALARNTPTFYMSGSIAEAAIWSVALSDAEVTLLARGYSPTFVRPEYVKAYWQLVRDPDTEKVGGYNMIGYNTPTVARHPPIVYPSAVQRVASGVPLPIIMQHYQKTRVA